MDPSAYLPIIHDVFPDKSSRPSDQDLVQWMKARPQENVEGLLEAVFQGAIQGKRSSIVGGTGSATTTTTTRTPQQPTTKTVSKLSTKKAATVVPKRPSPPTMTSSSASTCKISDFLPVRKRLHALPGDGNTITIDDSSQDDDHDELMDEVVVITPSNQQFPRLLGQCTAIVDSRIRSPHNLKLGQRLSVRVRAATTTTTTSATRRFGSSSSSNSTGVGPLFLSTDGGDDVASFPDTLADLFKPLMQERIVAIEATVTHIPARLQYFTPIEVDLYVCLQSPKSFDCFVKDEIVKPQTEYVSDRLFKVILMTMGEFVPDCIVKPIQLCDEDDEDPNISSSSAASAPHINIFNSIDNIQVCDPPPEGLTVTLRPYQEQAVMWMKHREEAQHSNDFNPFWETRTFPTTTPNNSRHHFFLNRTARLASFDPPPPQEPCRGCILGDDMGLGKTVMVIARILQSRQEDTAKGMRIEPTLVICKTSLMSQWINELKNKVNVRSFMAYAYHDDASRKIDLMILRQKSVVVTTYGVVAQEHSNSHDSVLFKMHWRRIVIDEAHEIRNANTDTCKAVCALNATSRIALTGTPFQNSLMLFCGVGNSSSSSTEQQQDDDHVEASPQRKFVAQLAARYFAMGNNHKTKDSAAAASTRSSQMECPVCLVSLDPSTDERMSTQTCLHVFCPDCASLTVRDTCPVCRTPIGEGNNLVRLVPTATLATASWRRYLHLNPATLLKSDQFCLSSKLKAIQEIILHSRQARSVDKQKPDKFLCFSQFTTFLDYCEVALKAIGVRFERLDGSHSIPQRARAVEAFKSPNCECLLMSLKAGGLGLNLTQANVVILCDPWWAAAPEHQAVGRCHRYGQTRPVTVKRLLASRTVEEKILQIQERKLAMGQYALGCDLVDKDFKTSCLVDGDDDVEPTNDEQSFLQSTKLTIDDLKSLFAKE